MDKAIPDGAFRLWNHKYSEVLGIKEPWVSTTPFRDLPEVRGYIILYLNCIQVCDLKLWWYQIIGSSFSFYSLNLIFSA